MFAYLVSTLVSVLLANVISLLFWIKAALRPYSLASVCKIRGWAQSIIGKGGPEESVTNP